MWGGNHKQKNNNNPMTTKLKQTTIAIILTLSVFGNLYYFGNQYYAKEKQKLIQQGVIFVFQQVREKGSVQLNTEQGNIILIEKK